MKRLFLTMAVAAFIGCAESKLPSISINTSEIISENFIGNGAQWSAYPHADSPESEWGMVMTDAKWEMVFKRLDFMKPKLVRVMDQANWRYLKGVDSKGKPILDFESQEVKSLEKLLGYCQKNDITLMFGEWGCPGFDNKTMFKGANDPQWIAIIIKYLDYLVNQKGYTCIKYYTLINEPNGYWASTKGNWDEWSEGIKILKSALDESGLSAKISICGPDVVAAYDNPESKYKGFEWVSQSVVQLNDQVGLYEIHAYTLYDLVRSGKFYDMYKPSADEAKSVNKQIVFGEIGFEKMTDENQARIAKDPFASEDSQMSVYDYSYGVDIADVGIQIMNAGYSGSAVWSLDDAMHTLGDKGDKSQLKRWGFWNSLGTEICNNPDDENIRPWFYTWSLMCRYFPDGISVVSCDTEQVHGVRATVGVTADNNITIAIVNSQETACDFNIKFASAQVKEFKQYIYTEDNRPIDEDGFAIPLKQGVKFPKRGTQVNLPARSFTLFTSINY